MSSEYSVEVIRTETVTRSSFAPTFERSFDFEFAAPGRPIHVLAAFARMCVPIDTAADADLTGRGALDPVARLRVVADGYRLDMADRPALMKELTAQFERGGQFVRRRVEAGEPAFIEMWNAMGGQARYDRRAAWFAVERDRVLEALMA